MQNPLTHLSGLLDFEAAARLGGFKPAAAERHKTPAAVSQQVKGLEQTLGLQLFVRHARHVSITPAGQELAASVTHSLTLLRDKVQQLRQQQDPHRLRISTTHSLALKWLVPRLHGFTQQHPAIDVQIDADDGRVDLQGGGFDLALRYGPYDAQSSLYQEQRVLVAAPTLLPTPRPLAELLRLPLLCEEDEAEWQALLAARGLHRRHLDFSRRYSHSGLLVQAAVAAQGIALAPFSLACEDLRRGQLVRLAEAPWPSRYGYTLLHSPLRRTAAQPFALWLQGEFAALTGELNRAEPAQTHARRRSAGLRASPPRR